MLLGVQQAPPNQVINGIAFLLSIYVMFPTGVKMYDAAQQAVGKQAVPQELVSGQSAVYILQVANAAKEPLRDFLKNNSLTQHHRTFLKLSTDCFPKVTRDQLKPDGLYRPCSLIYYLTTEISFRNRCADLYPIHL